MQLPEIIPAFLQRRCCFFYGFIIYHNFSLVKYFFEIYAIYFSYTCILRAQLLHFHIFTIFYEFDILIYCNLHRLYLSFFQKRAAQP